MGQRAEGCRRRGDLATPAFFAGGALGCGDRALRRDALLDVGQRLLHLVDQDQAQIAGIQSFERVVDGLELAVDFFHVAGATAMMLSEFAALFDDAAIRQA